MIDEGLLARIGEKSSYVRVTAAGCDFLNTFSDEGLWEKTKDGAKAVGGMTLGMMRDLALGYIKQEAAEKLGIKI